jgi:hypothetical protein
MADPIARQDPELAKALSELHRQGLVEFEILPDGQRRWFLTNKAKRLTPDEIERECARDSGPLSA